MHAAGAEHRGQLHGGWAERVRRRSEALHRLRKLRQRLQCGGEEHALHELPADGAPKPGATIFTQTKVEWLEKLAAGGWRIHGKHVNDDGSGNEFTLDAGEVILSAGSLNSTEILLRSEMHGLSVSPALGTKFSGNGDFFGLAYNGDYADQRSGIRRGRQRRVRAILPSPGRTSWAWCATPAACPKRSASPWKISLSRAPMWRPARPPSG